MTWLPPEICARLYVGMVDGSNKPGLSSGRLVFESSVLRYFRRSNQGVFLTLTMWFCSLSVFHNKSTYYVPVNTCKSIIQTLKIAARCIFSKCQRVTKCWNLTLWERDWGMRTCWMRTVENPQIRTARKLWPMTEHDWKQWIAGSMRINLRPKHAKESFICIIISCTKPGSVIQRRPNEP